MCTKLSIQHRVTSSFHPQANGLIERMHCTLKASLRAKFSLSWSAELPLILLRILSAPRETAAISSFERVFDVPPILPGNYWGSAETPNPAFLEDFQQAIQSTTRPSTKLNRMESPSVPGDLATCKFVFIRVDGSGRPPFSPLYLGPFLVIKRNKSTFILQIGTRQEFINVSRLKPSYTPPDASPALPLP